MLFAQTPSHDEETSLQQDAVRAANVTQDNSWPWRSWASIGHVLLISVFYGNVFQQSKRSRVICSIQHDSLLFTTPLTIWQGCIHHYFMQTKRGESWPGFDAETAAMSSSCWAHWLTSEMVEKRRELQANLSAQPVLWRLLYHYALQSK